MKAERRHALKENELAKVIQGAPTFWQKSGGKFLVIAIAVLMIAILIHYRTSSYRDSLAQATDDLAIARTSIEQLQSIAGMAQVAPAQELSMQIKTLYNEANKAISEAVNLSDDRTIQAEALIVRGDLNWTVASLPEPAGAATQPSLLIKPSKELVDTAADAYQTVLNNYSDEKYAQFDARFSLAAIAENRDDWDAAKAQYEKIAAEATDFAAYQQLASLRLLMLAQIRKPVILAKAATMPVPTTSAILPPMIAAPAGPISPVPATAPAMTPAAATQPVAPSK